MIIDEADTLQKRIGDCCTNKPEATLLQIFGDLVTEPRGNRNVLKIGKIIDNRPAINEPPEII